MTSLLTRCRRSSRENLCVDETRRESSIHGPHQVDADREASGRVPVLPNTFFGISETTRLASSREPKNFFINWCLYNCSNACVIDSETSQSQRRESQLLRWHWTIYNRETKENIYNDHKKRCEIFHMGSRHIDVYPRLLIKTEREKKNERVSQQKCHEMYT